MWMRVKSKEDAMELHRRPRLKTSPKLLIEYKVDTSLNFKSQFFKDALYDMYISYSRCVTMRKAISQSHMKSHRLARVKTSFESEAEIR